MEIDVPQGLAVLQGGDFTRRDSLVKSIAIEIKSESERMEAPLWRTITDYLSHFQGQPDREKDPKAYEEFDARRKKEFRKRTASQILESRRLNGCTERGLAFLALAREVGVPSIYVETFKKSWLQGSSGDGYQGHIFVDLFVDDSWVPYETKRGFPNKPGYFRDKDEFVVVGKGVDFSSVYLLQADGTYAKSPIAIDGFSKLRELEANFRERFRV